MLGDMYMTKYRNLVRYAKRHNCTNEQFQYISNCIDNIFMLWCCRCKGADREDMIRGLVNVKGKGYTEALFGYCLHIVDDERIWKALANAKTPNAAEWKYHYCYYIKDRDEVWQALAQDRYASKWHFDYYRLVKPRPEMISALAMDLDNDAPEYQYKFCAIVKDNEIVWRSLASNPNAAHWQLSYWIDVKKRPEMRDAILKSDDMHTIHQLRYWEDKS